jgi:AhpD family alkylhydroperoxidase
MKRQLTQERVYEEAISSFGIVPPLIREIAEVSVPAAALYVDGVSTMNESTFSEIEINAIELRISSMNACESCMKGHSYLLKKAGVAQADIDAIINGLPTSTMSLNRVLRGTEAIFRANRSGYSNQIEKLIDDDFSRKEIFEIIALLSLKTISNNINNYLKTVRAVEPAM